MKIGKIYSNFLHIGSLNLPLQPQLQSLLWLPWEVLRSEIDALVYTILYTILYNIVYSLY